MKILMYPIFIYRILTKASILSPEARKETKRTYVKNKYLKKIYFSNDSSIEIKFFSKTNWEKSQSIPICLSLFFSFSRYKENWYQWCETWIYELVIDINWISYIITNENENIFPFMVFNFWDIFLNYWQ